MTFIWKFWTKIYYIRGWRVVSVTTGGKDKTRHSLLRIKVRFSSVLYIIVNVVPPFVNKIPSEIHRRTKKIFSTTYNAPFREQESCFVLFCTYRVHWGTVINCTSAKEKRLPKGVYLSQKGVWMEIERFRVWVPQLATRGPRMYCAALGQICKLYMYCKNYTVLLICLRVTRDPDHNNGCGPLPYKGWTPAM
jgi:hypothetical protein